MNAIKNFAGLLMKRELVLEARDVKNKELHAIKNLRIFEKPKAEFCGFVHFKVFSANL